MGSAVLAAFEAWCAADAAAISAIDRVLEAARAAAEAAGADADGQALVVAGVAGHLRGFVQGIGHLLTAEIDGEAS